MRRLRPAVVLPLLVLALVLVSLLTYAVSRSGSGPDTASATPGATAASRAPATGSAPLVVPQGSGTPAPARVRVPSLGVDSALERLRTGRGGELQAPRAWQRAGWFADGTRPGATGPAVIAGHVDSPDGPAVFARLAELSPGDVVDVVRRDGSTVHFRVDRTEEVQKDGFPTAEVYGPTPDAQLRLITCDGEYVRSSGGYQGNLVVFASATRG